LKYLELYAFARSHSQGCARQWKSSVTTVSGLVLVSRNRSARKDRTLSYVGGFAHDITLQTALAAQPVRYRRGADRVW
jgi:hypothetical protein